MLAQCGNETLISQIIISWCHSEQVQGLPEHRPVARLSDIINVILAADAESGLPLPSANVQFQATWWRFATSLAPWTVSSATGRRGRPAVHPVAAG